jgi:hypothetical protein
MRFDKLVRISYVIDFRFRFSLVRLGASNNYLRVLKDILILQLLSFSLILNYSRVQNKRAANLIKIWVLAHLHAYLVYTFIQYFRVQLQIHLKDAANCNFKTTCQKFLKESYRNNSDMQIKCININYRVSQL